MDLNQYLATLRDDLATTASAGDESMRRAAAVLGAAIEPAARLAMMNALSDLAAEVTAALPDHVVELRLDGRDVRVVVTQTSSDTTETPKPPPFDGGDMSRMTLRLFEELKAKAEQAASAQGVSLNTFVQQAVQGALHGKGKWDKAWEKSWEKKDGSRVQGWYEG
ncbi:toxin-antitoxin system HicB family antitoxin [Actinokineospora sp. HUAS TT18]|uniref:toxin-antitoxin system HicB family antitoxin n=1 Tax=Actinokineospora sp. HUAS TT18 TaxID=3447451 RepID=UPI003F51E3DC